MADSSARADLAPFVESVLVAWPNHTDVHRATVTFTVEALRPYLELALHLHTVLADVQGVIELEGALAVGE